MTLLKKQARGRWAHGVGPADLVKVVDFRAGGLVTVDQEGATFFGPPTEFESEEGISGPNLLEELLPAPTVDQLYRGCLREALATAASIAQLGRQDTREWQSLNTYVVDDNEGGRLLLIFQGPELVGVGFSDDPWRSFSFDDAVLAVPPSLQAIAQELGRDPFFEMAGRHQHTALFWSVDGTVSGGEPWPTIYTYTADLLRGELLEEGDWLDETPSRSGISQQAALAAARVARSARLPVSPVSLPQGTVDVLLPKSAPHRTDGQDSLFDGGVFERIARGG